jgi:hypothetical protein
MKYVIVVVVLVVLAFMVMDFNSRTADLSRLTGEHAVVKAERDAKVETKAAIEGKIAFATSEAAVYQWAYENHMVRKGDIPVVPVEGVQPTVVATPRPVATQSVVTNLDRWLLLFVDPE